MERPNCAPTENLVRAIRTSDWDPKKNRWSSGLFAGPETSVSRTEVLPMKEILKIFCKDLHKPPVHEVIKTGEITVGELKRLGEEFKINNKLAKKIITIVEDPIEDQPPYTDNPAHALILEKLPRSLSFEIIDNLDYKGVRTCSQKPLMLNVMMVIALAILGLAGFLI